MTAPILGLIACVRADLKANNNNPKFQFFLALFRCASALNRILPKLLARFLVDLPYRIATEALFSLEIPLKTQIGPGLTIYHGFGIVINDHATLGAGVVLRNGVVIGNRHADGPCPTISDGVDIGAHALIIGGVTIGHEARIGAGAIVTRHVESGAVVIQRSVQ